MQRIKSCQSLNAKAFSDSVDLNPLDLNLINQINLSQKVLAAARPLDFHRIQNLLLSRIWNRRAIKVDPLLCLIALQTYKLCLIETPLISNMLTTVHASYWDNHSLLETKRE